MADLQGERTDLVGVGLGLGLRPDRRAAVGGGRLLGLGGGGRGGDSNGVGLADSVVNSALRFRAQAPLIDQLLREIGVQGGELGAIAQNMSAAALSAPNLAPNLAPARSSSEDAS